MTQKQLDALKLGRTGIGMRGKKHSEETKRKMGTARRAENNGMWKGGVPSCVVCNTPLSSYIAKVCSLHKGHFNKGEAHYAYNKKKSPEVIKKISDSKIGKPTWNKGKRTGIVPPNKIGEGITPLCMKIRKCFKYKEWRAAIFIRDRYTCLNCGKIGGTIHADHIKPFSKILKEYNIKNYDDSLKCEILWDINNGRTLCKRCHKEVGWNHIDEIRKTKTASQTILGL